MTETEPNDDPSVATAIPMAYFGSGGISPEGDVDWWDSSWQYSGSGTLPDETRNHPIRLQQKPGKSFGLAYLDP